MIDRKWLFGITNCYFIQPSNCIIVIIYIKLYIVVWSYFAYTDILLKVVICICKNLNLSTTIISLSVYLNIYIVILEQLNASFWTLNNYNISPCQPWNAIFYYRWLVKLQGFSSYAVNKLNTNSVRNCVNPDQFLVKHAYQEKVLKQHGILC